MTISNSLTGDSEQTYHYGDTPSFDLTPSEGLHISSVVYNGTNVTTSLIEHTYTTPPIVDHSELSVNYSTTTSVDLTTKEHSISIRVHNSDIDICGTQQGDRVDIFALNGKRIQSCIANGEDVKFTLTNHKMCIVRVGQSAFKVIL